MLLPESQGGIWRDSAVAGRSRVELGCDDCEHGSGDPVVLMRSEGGGEEVVVVVVVNYGGGGFGA